MTPHTLTSQLEELSLAIGANSALYNDRNMWSSVGDTELDQQLTRLANIFVDIPRNQQQIVREAVHPRALWNLIVFVRRLAILILKTSDPIWLRRALTIAAIENGRSDFRDLIVSLVIARAAAERVDMDYVAQFNWCLDAFTPASKGSFTNARDHAECDVRDILRNFGPPELLPKRRKRN